MQPLRSLLPVGALALLAATAACAQQAPAAEPIHHPAYYLLNAVFSLAVVIGLIYAVYFGLRRLSQRGLPGPTGQMEIVESRHLGGGRWVYVLRVGQRVLIVGGGTEGLRTLAEMSAQEYHAEQPESGRRGDAGNEIGP